MNKRDKSCIPSLKKEQYTFNIGTLNPIGEQMPEIKKLYEVLDRMPSRSGRGRPLVRM